MEKMYDVKIVNGILIDPQKKQRQNANLYIKDGRIAGLSSGDFLAGETLDAAGRIVCPGFIDPHAHADGITAYRDLIRCAELSLRQGVTTMVSGNCGASVTDMEGFFNFMNNGFPVSQAELLGFSSVRKAIGLEDIFAAATKEQIARMEAVCAHAMEQGACGISFGLGYTPGTSMEEVVSMARVARRYGRIMAVDTRMEDNNDLSCLKEMIAVAEETGVRVQISHFVYQYGQGIIWEALALMDEARARGVDIWADSGLYVDWATGIGSECFRESFVLSGGCELGSLLVATGRYTGRRMDDELYWEMRTQYPRDTVICKTGWESSVYPPFTKDYIMPSSDTAPYNVGEGHPQIAGSFAGFFKMARENGMMPLEEAVYRCTLLPATVLGLSTKGRLSEGSDADLVIFDEEEIRDTSAYPDEGRPDAPAKGIDTVLIGGKRALSCGEPTGTNLGRAIML